MTDEEALDELLELYADKIQPFTLTPDYRKTVDADFEKAKAAFLVRMRKPPAGDQDA